MHQAIVENDVTLAQNASGLQREEFRVARTCTDEVKRSDARLR